MKWEVIDLKAAPESLQNRINEKLSMYEGEGEVLKVIETDHSFTAYMNVGNLCTVLTVWKFNVDEVNEDSMTIGDIKVFMDHPTTNWWFS